MVHAGDGHVQGGHMASLAAGFWNKPLAVVPCMSNATSAMVFVDGLLSSVVAWHALDQGFHQVLPQSFISNI